MKDNLLPPPPRFKGIIHAVGRDQHPEQKPKRRANAELNPQVEQDDYHSLFPSTTRDFVRQCLCKTRRMEIARCSLAPSFSSRRGNVMVNTLQWTRRADDRGSEADSRLEKRRRERTS